MSSPVYFGQRVTGKMALEAALVRPLREASQLADELMAVVLT